MTAVAYEMDDFMEAEGVQNNANHKGNQDAPSKQELDSIMAEADEILRHSSCSEIEEKIHSLAFHEDYH